MSQRPFAAEACKQTRFHALAGLLHVFMQGMVLIGFALGLSAMWSIASMVSGRLCVAADHSKMPVKEKPLVFRIG